MTKSIAVFALLVACSPPRYPENPVHVGIEVVIDTAFTDAQVNAIAFGADDWVRATDGLEITVYNAPCSQFRPAQSICVETRRCNEPKHVGCWVKADRDIGLDVGRLSLKDLRQIATHEIGHALGLSHNGRGTAMAYRLDLMTPPTCADIEAFWDLYDVHGVCKAQR